MSFYDVRCKCAKCRHYKPLAGGHQRAVPGKGVYFVCAECKPFMEQFGEVRPRDA